MTQKVVRSRTSRSTPPKGFDVADRMCKYQYTKLVLGIVEATKQVPSRTVSITRAVSINRAHRMTKNTRYLRSPGLSHAA